MNFWEIVLLKEQGHLLEQNNSSTLWRYKSTEPHALSIPSYWVLHPRDSFHQRVLVPIKTNIATARVKRNEIRRKIIRVAKQQAEPIIKAINPITITTKTNIKDANSVAPKAPHPWLVHVVLVYLKCTPAIEIAVIANIYKIIWIKLY